MNSKKDIIQPRKLKGFRDYNPRQMGLRRRITEAVWDVAAQAGFHGIATPALEYAETLLGAGGGDTDKEVYRFMDHGERMVALRFDLTVPFARYVAENQGELTFPFKKVQIGDVWRGEKPQKGRYREFCQADLDIVGVDSLEADVEILQCMMDALARVIPGPFTVRIGNRAVLSALVKTLLPQVDAEGERQLLIALDKLRKIGRDAVLKLMQEVPGAAAASCETLLTSMETVDQRGDTDMVAMARLLGGETPDWLRFRESMDLLRRLLQNTSCSVVLDMTITRGLNYYTGLVFETFIDALPGFGSISSGGRYNELVSRFSTMELPGVGGSVGVDRLLAALEELTPVEEGKRSGVFVAIATVDARDFAFEVAQSLRQQGVVTDIAVKPGKVGNQFKLADRLASRWVVVIGTDEKARGCVTLKDLSTGQEQKDVALGRLVELVR